MIHLRNRKIASITACEIYAVLSDHVDLNNFSGEINDEGLITVQFSGDRASDDESFIYYMKGQ